MRELESLGTLPSPQNAIHKAVQCQRQHSGGGEPEEVRTSASRTLGREVNLMSFGFRVLIAAAIMKRLSTLIAIQVVANTNTSAAIRAD